MDSNSGFPMQISVMIFYPVQKQNFALPVQDK